MAEEPQTPSSNMPEWWQRVVVRQRKLHESREAALAHNEQETTAICKQLLREAEAMVKTQSSEWIRRADDVLAEHSPEELRRDT